MGELYEISENSFTRDSMLSALRTGLTPIEVAKMKWEAILSGGEDFGSSSCACCATYFDRDDKKACLTVCPLGNTDGCCNGEYGVWVRHQNDAHMHEFISYAIRCEKCEEIAKDIYKVINQRVRELGLLHPKSQYLSADNKAI